jgi:ribosomal protein L11 methylase PrmA
MKTVTMNNARQVASFRDPSGFVFREAGVLYRQVNRSYAGDYDHLLNSGLYQNLTAVGLLIAHEEAALERARTEEAYKVLQPQQIPFITYPYEWSFSQLQDAALLHLRILRRALRHGMVLKDCSGYNVQFHRGKPIFIDTLSFERYQEGEPWVAYRQFCQHFLAPLALMSYRDIRLGQLLRVHLDGIPLDLAAALLPRRTVGVLPLLLHIHLHAASQRRSAGGGAKPPSSRRFSRQALDGLSDGLLSAVRRLTWRSATTGWTTYYEGMHNYSEQAAAQKKEIVARWVERMQPQTVWDLGANTGLYSRIASSRGIETIAFDLDPGSVERNYHTVREQKESHLLPLLMDLTNPSPAIGWANAERMSLAQRGPADLALALALVHHLAIGNNLPFDYIAGFLHQVCQALVVEFVPKSDGQVQQLLRSRKDIFPDYSEAAFVRHFSTYFRVIETVPLCDSERKLYLMVQE